MAEASEPLLATTSEPAAPEGFQPPRTVLILTVLALGLVAAILASDLPQPVRRATSGIALLVSCSSLATVCLLRSRRSQAGRRQAWALFGAAAGAAALGNIWLTVVDLAGLSEFTQIGNALILVSVAIILVGLLAYPFGPRHLYDFIRLLLDTVVLGGSILLILSNTVLPRVAEHPTSSTIALVLAPVIDIIMATVIWLLVLRARPADKTGLGLTAAGFVLFSLSEIAAAIGRSHGTFAFGTVTDIGWIAGYAMLAIAIMWSPSTFPTPPDIDSIDRSPVVRSLIIFVVFLAAAWLSFSTMYHGTDPATVLSLLATVTVAILVRQMLLLADNDRLRARLEQRVAERSTELAEVTQRADLMVNSVEDGVYGVDSVGRITFVNPAGARLLGTRRSELLGASAHQRFHSHSAGDCYLRAIVHTGVATTGIEDSYRTTDGRQIPVEVSASPMVDSRGVRGVVVVFRDITRRREVDQLKNEFVSMVSHELKTPLTAIRGSLGLLSGGALGELTPPATRMVEIALESSERLTRLINEILDMERIEAGSLPMEISSHASAELLQAAYDQVQVLASDAAITVVIATAEGVVLADADRVVQTLINLVGNAIKFSPPGSRVVMAAAPAPEDQVAFRVVDQGRGIPTDRLELIFERFEQVDSSDARDKGGSGLGLAISRSIVHRLGGRIWAENNPDGGSTFTFTMPAGRDEKVED